MELVLVNWVDSRGVGQEWSVVSDINEGVCKMQSVGWVLKKTKKQICIAPHVGLEKDGDHQVCGEMHIPMSCVRSVVKLPCESRKGKEIW